MPKREQGSTATRKAANSSGTTKTTNPNANATRRTFGLVEESGRAVAVVELNGAHRARDSWLRSTRKYPRLQVASIGRGKIESIGRRAEISSQRSIIEKSRAMPAIDRPLIAKPVSSARCEGWRSSGRHRQTVFIATKAPIQGWPRNVTSPHALEGTPCRICRIAHRDDAGYGFSAGSHERQDFRENGLQSGIGNAT